MKNIVSLVMLTIGSLTFVSAKENADIIVAQDGSGQFKNIQDAIDSVPAEIGRNVVILIRNGVYHEKIFITKSHISLVGEDRDSTRIIFAVLRKNVNATPLDMRKDWGTAVINIDSSVTDLTIANLTVHNNYGSLYITDDHQFAIRGNGTRIIILNCNIIADGGDTLSLWNKKEGMYYHANCYFEGGVDYVCPRGWCYITDSKFFGHSLSASIWHDGDAEKSQKFVIRYSSFDGVQGFPLGRNHRDGQIFLLDCRFSKTMADTPIYWPAGSRTTWIWGDRHYFYNCHRDGGDYAWFKDNLETAENSPKENEVTAKWTFDGKWDPEETIPSVLPMVFLPRPRDGATQNVNKPLSLRWVPARNAISHKVYFGTSARPAFKKNQKNNSYHPGFLKTKTTYYWRIDEVTETGTLRGPLWHFTTE
ncbi:MAG: pectin esterase [Ignavibacteriae bacterium]|nr:MAG: pectin esterase [Ignavibacteriota bacterium]